MIRPPCRPLPHPYSHRGMPHQRHSFFFTKMGLAILKRKSSCSSWKQDVITTYLVQEILNFKSFECTYTPSMRSHDETLTKPTKKCCWEKRKQLYIVEISSVALSEYSWYIILSEHWLEVRWTTIEGTVWENRGIMKARLERSKHFANMTSSACLVGSFPLMKLALSKSFYLLSSS